MRFGSVVNCSQAGMWADEFGVVSRLFIVAGTEKLHWHLCQVSENNATAAENTHLWTFSLNSNHPFPP